MSVEIEKAMERLDARKKAALGGFHVGGNTAPTDVYRRAFSGLDLDLGEIREVREIVAQTFVSAVQQGHDPWLVAAEMFIDGVATGLLIADERARTGAGA